MIFERIKSEGIAHNSYLIGSENEAAVIDPRRDCQVYIDLAQQSGLRIKYIFETHRNEDYVIGSVELNHLTGTEIYHGPGLDWKYGNTLRERQQFQIGKLRLTTIYTPGHTDESMSYAMADLSTGEATVMVFTGDALFVGDVGRTDLYGPEEVPRLASNLYDSIFNKLLPLGDGVSLWREYCRPRCEHTRCRESPKPSTSDEQGRIRKMQISRKNGKASLLPPDGKI